MELEKLFRHAWGLLVKDIGQLIVGLLLAGVIPGLAAGAVVLVAMLVAMPGFATVSAADDAEVAMTAAGAVALVAASIAALAIIVLVSIPLYAGVVLGALRRVREGRVMGYWDLFTGFRVFGRVVRTYLIAYLLVPPAVVAVPAAVIVVGAALASIPVLVIGAVLVAAAIVALVYLTVCWVFALVVAIDRGVGAVEALRESRELVHRTGWWWIVLALFLLQLVVTGVSVAAAVVPLAGVAVSVVTTPFSLTWLLAMYFQSRREDWMIDAALAAAPPPPATGNA